MTPDISAITPARTHIVLVGGGHSHVTVIRAFGMKPEPGVVLTIIAKEIEAPYSGMLPGYVAGHYSYDDCHIDLVRLANWAGARVIHGAATGIDRAAKQVLIEGRAPLGYDLLSIDVGITPALDSIKGAAEHGIAVKPVSTFAEKWQALEARALEPGGPRRIAVVGSGAAGFELVLAARHRLMNAAASRGIERGAFSFTLIGSKLLPSHIARAQRLARAAIRQQGVELIEGVRVSEVSPDAVVLDDGRTIPADAVLLATKAGPARWFAESRLPLDEAGFIAVRPSLQLMDDDDVFAVGDCASVLEYPREKAGVFAVRQGPPLTDNLRRRARGDGAVPFVPQTDFLTLLSTGGRHAIAARNGFAWSGDWVWVWKDRIDREFMDKFNVLPPPMGADAAALEAMRCAGCAAKVGPVTLAAALDRLQSGAKAARDDAAMIEDGGARVRLETIDFFRALWPEPYLFGQIAASHAMNDVLAMGGTPTHALANVVLPYAQPNRVEEDLFQLLAGARAAFATEGVEIVGGHSSEGAELAAGFFVSGTAERAGLWRKGGLMAGDQLILTRPLGTGILFAALMRGLARGPAIFAALTEMARSNGPVARALAGHPVSAATDVTGFGLAGHLIEMLEASGVTAQIDLGSLPLYASVKSLADAGVESSLLAENARRADLVSGAAMQRADVRAVLFDPQTAGGLLVGVPAASAEAVVGSLRDAGAGAASIIGGVVAAAPGERPGLIRLSGTFA